MATWATDGTDTGNNYPGGSVQWVHDNQASDGDTITLPVGTYTWQRVVLTKGITLLGQGVGVTIVKDDGSDTSPRQFLAILLKTGGQLTRITGIEFQDGGRVTPVDAPAGNFKVVGSNLTNKAGGGYFRMDHCKWVDMKGHPVFDTVMGVMDHNEWIVNTTGRRFMHTIYANFWNGDATLSGSSYNGYDASWHDPPGWGSWNFLFMEDETWTNNVGGNYGATDAYGGARFVIRYSDLHNATINNHGTESVGRARGGYVEEIYNNTLSWTSQTSLGGWRSGVSLFWGNTTSSTMGATHFDLENYRNFHPFTPWGGADGTNVWDVNDPTDYFTGTAAGNSVSHTVTVNGNPGWTTDHWKDYELRRTTNLGSNPGNAFSSITANTSNTITYHGSFNGTTDLIIAAGDSLEIRYVIHALDQCGRGQGSQIAAGGPTPPAGWNDQLTIPMYFWNNTSATGSFFVTSTLGVRAGIHSFNNTQPPAGWNYTPAAYPHFLVSGQALGKIISLSGIGLDFGNVTIGLAPTGTLNVNNIGDAALTVTSVSYPTGFSGATGGFTVAANGTHAITVTFTPLLEQLYSGNITVASDADSGANTIGVSGTGVSSPTPHGHRRHPRDSYGF